MNRLLTVLCVMAAAAFAAPQQPKIEARKAPVLTKDGLKFRDLNKNGVLDPLRGLAAAGGAARRRPASPNDAWKRRPA